MNDKRNAMTNAERQKRYRDKKRGGPPRGRWADHVPIALHAQSMGATRTMVFMARWISEHAPAFADDIEAGTTRLTPIYRRLRAEYDSALVRFLKDSPAGQGRLVAWRHDGQFCFGWVDE